jgi:hypothetical protein
VIRSIPADVWAAVTLAVAILVFAVAEPIPAIAAAAFLLLCAHLVVEAFGGTDWCGF